MTESGRKAGERQTVLGLLKRAVWSVRLIPMGMILLYQMTLSPDHSPLMTKLLRSGVCRFHPTCSQYTYEAIEKYGVFKGGAMGAWRICRCNPFNPGGFDPVP